MNALYHQSGSLDYHLHWSQGTKGSLTNWIPESLEEIDTYLPEHPTQMVLVNEHLIHLHHHFRKNGYPCDASLEDYTCKGPLNDRENTAESRQEFIRNHTGS